MNEATAHEMIVTTIGTVGRTGGTDVDATTTAIGIFPALRHHLGIGIAGIGVAQATTDTAIAGTRATTLPGP